MSESPFYTILLRIGDLPKVRVEVNDRTNVLSFIGVKSADLSLFIGDSPIDSTKGAKTQIQ